MKDHEIRGVVNELTEVANRHAGHQCLRECIANVIVPVLKNRLPRPQTSREAFMKYVKDNYISTRSTFFDTDSSGKYVATVRKKEGQPDFIGVQHLWEVWNHGSK